MARQTIIWTALPNGISETSEGKFVSLSVYVSIRLYSSNDQLLTLNQYSDFLTWSERVKGDVQFAIDFGNGVQVPATDVRFQNGQIEPELWTALFTASTQVKPYKFEKPEPSYIQSYPVKNIETFLQEEYADIAVQWPERFPDATWLQQRLAKVQFFQYEPKSPIATGLRQNLRQRTPGLNRQQTMQRLGGINQGFSKALSRHLDGILKHSTMMLKAESGDVIKSIAADVQKYGAVKNGAPEPSRDFLQLALFHTTQNAPETDPQKAKINPVKRLPLAIPQLDFHEAISSLGDYPGLQRKLGLVLDLLVPVPQGMPQSSKVRVRPTWQKKLSTQTVDFTPKTVYEYGPSLFRTKARGDADLKNGLLDVSNSNLFDVVQLDIDGGAIKLMNTAATIEQMDLPEEPPKPILLADAGSGGLGKVLGMTHLLNAAENLVQTVSVPSLRSSGLSIVRSNRPLQLISMLNLSGKYNASVKIAEQNPTVLTQPALPGSQAEKAEVVLYAEDIVRGYRVDVWDSVTLKWHSLCKRKGMFAFERVSGLAREILEEGMVGMGVTSAADGSTDELRLHEALFRWEGWSLVSTMPGKVINEEDNPVPFTNESKTPYGL